VWERKGDDGDLFDAKVTVERTDADEIQIGAESSGGQPQTIFRTRFAAGQVAQALEAAAASEWS
jgi:hypothetical protein